MLERGNKSASINSLDYAIHSQRELHAGIMRTVIRTNQICHLLVWQRSREMRTPSHLQPSMRMNYFARNGREEFSMQIEEGASTDWNKLDTIGMNTSLLQSVDAEDSKFSTNSMHLCHQVHWFLGMRVSQDANGIKLIMRYILDLL